MMDPNYRPDDWLGLLIAGQLYVEFASDPPVPFEQSMDELIQQIDSALAD
jgi:hypothetical protein